MKKKNKTFVEEPSKLLLQHPDHLILQDPESKQKSLELKIHYLTQETTDLKSKNDDLNKLLKQNQEYLKLIFQEDPKTAKASTDISNSFKMSKNNNTKDGVIQSVLEGVYNENQRLYELLEKISKERDEARSKVSCQF